MSPSTEGFSNNKVKLCSSALAEGHQRQNSFNFEEEKKEKHQKEFAIALSATRRARSKTTFVKTTTRRAMKLTSSIMKYRNIFALVALVLLLGSESVQGLKCHMCGQYNEGVGSITPCLNYADKNASLYLKECSKKSEKFCVKYVSELSTVRDCATECIEKEIWETQTYCCSEDGCNASSNIEVSALVLMVPLIYFIVTYLAGLKFSKMYR